MAQRRLEGVQVAALVADGFEQMVLTAPMDRLKQEGAEVEIVSLRPGSVQGMNLLVLGKTMDVDRIVGGASPADYHALLLPGGLFSPDFLRQSDRALKFVRAFEEAGKPIAVICHGPWVLISAGLVWGRRLTSWPGIRDDVRNAGGAWSDKPIVRDENWVSSRGPQDLPKFNDAVVALLSERVPMSERGKRRRTPARRWLAGSLALVALGYGVRRM